MLALSKLSSNQVAKNDNLLNGLPGNHSPTQTKPKESLKANEDSINPYLKHYRETNRLLNRNKKNLGVESPYSTQPVLSKDAEPTAHGAKTLSKGNNAHSTQTTPKENLIQRLDRDIKGRKEVEGHFLKAKENKGIFSPQNDNIYYSNTHIGSGLVGGTLTGVNKDEEENISFNPAKFAAGFLGGGIGSFAIARGFSKVKKIYYEKNFNKFIDFVNKNKPQKPAFKVTSELEKVFRENEINEKLKKDLN